MILQKPVDHLWILLTVALGTYSQLILRWQMTLIGSVPVELLPKVQFIILTALKPWVLSALFATFLAGLSWMVVLSKFELTYAFPFTALNFIVILAAGAMILGETITPAKIIGTLIVLAGIMVMALIPGGE
jgi:drug/metabolite transporter (DMT)-like permease